MSFFLWKLWGPSKRHDAFFWLTFVLFTVLCFIAVVLFL